MVTLKRPARVFSFTDWNKNQPKEPTPGDRLDAQFLELIDAISATQEALAEIRADDGTLRGVPPTPQLIAELQQRFEGQAAQILQRLAGAGSEAVIAEQNAQLFAEDAERALIVARQMISDWNVIRESAMRASDYAQRAAKSVDMEATEAENWANYSKAQADNAIKAKDESLQWAEYLAGPVVDPAQAPAYIAGSPFPHGLYYQPVEGGVAGLFSAKWWALQAYNLVGAAGIYYLGAWTSPPLPGEINPDTGQRVPDPLKPGSLYYDPNTGTLNVWNGSAWTQPTALSQAYTAQFTYQATAGQTVFSGADLGGDTPVVGTSPSDVYVNGVRLIMGEDYDVDAPTNTLTINTPLTVGSMVQWDLLIPSGKLAPGTVNAFKIKPITPDGTLTDFPLQYIDPDSGATVDAAVGDGNQLLVSLDGCVQEPGRDYTATGATIHFAEPPDATAAIWMIWNQPGAIA